MELSFKQVTGPFPLRSIQREKHKSISITSWVTIVQAFFFSNPMGFKCQESEQNPNAITPQAHLFMYFLLAFTKMSPSRKKHETALSRSGESDSSWPHALRPARLLCPWDSPGKSTGVGCHFLLQGYQEGEESLTVSAFHPRNIEVYRGKHCATLPLTGRVRSLLWIGLLFRNKDKFILVVY